MSGLLEPDAIARRVTDGLVEKFDCAFARIWLVEADQTALRLVASSGMYTHIDGSFARVAMGAFKVGKIAQNRVSFLSNNLPNEPWVKDREWAIANGICGFAGYPLVVQDRVVGVLAVFSHHPMAAEFLEALQNLCTTVTIALDIAIHYHHERQTHQLDGPLASLNTVSLSDQLAKLLHASRLTLVGTERSLSFSLVRVFLQAAEVLDQMECSYCRLTYGSEHVLLEAVVARSHTTDGSALFLESVLGDLLLSASCLGGELKTNFGPNQPIVEVLLKIPYPHQTLGPNLIVQCRQSVLQMAFTHLAYLAGLTVSNSFIPDALLLTDDIALISHASKVIWIQQETQPTPQGVQAVLDLSTNPSQMREAVNAVMQGNSWGIDEGSVRCPLLSNREQGIMTLLAQGLRDRDIAQHLHISESTVKFHINNILSKLKARNRYQAVYQATLSGWISVGSAWTQIGKT